jgi:hypothetical protein
VSISPAFFVNYVTGRRQITNVKVDRWLYLAFRILPEKLIYKETKRAFSCLYPPQSCMNIWNHVVNIYEYNVTHVKTWYKLWFPWFLSYLYIHSCTFCICDCIVNFILILKTLTKIAIVSQNTVYFIQSFLIWKPMETLCSNYSLKLKLLTHNHSLLCM